MFGNNLHFVSACMLTIIGAFCVFLLFKLRLTFWQRQKVPYIKPLTPLLGNLTDLLMLRTSFGDLFCRFYANPTSQNAPAVGFYIFTTPALLLRAPELVELVFIKNFDSFQNRYEAADPYHDALGSFALPLAKYPIWRECRKKVSEFFTSGRLKFELYPLMCEITKELELYVERKSDAVIDVKEMCALYTTDLTTLLSFGLRTHGLNNDDSEVRRRCRQLMQLSLVKTLHFFAIFFLPKLIGLFRAKVFPDTYMRYIREMVTDALGIKHKSFAFGATNLLDILLELKQTNCATGKLKFAQHPDFIISQAAIFLLAGYETSSSLLSFTLYELAKAPCIQLKLRHEISAGFATVSGNGKILSYKQLYALPYLNMVVNEALRLYPAAAFINRECTPPPHSSGFSLKPYVDFEVPRGMPVYVSILGLQRDPKYWPNPEQFNPERFASNAIKLIKPHTYIPFGAGPHSCVGARLGLLQLKLGLVHILRNHKVEVCERTAPRIQFSPKSFMLQAEGGLFLKFVKEPLLS